jgi:hypothetical protein
MSDSTPAAADPEMKVLTPAEREAIREFVASCLKGWWPYITAFVAAISFVGGYAAQALVSSQVNEKLHDKMIEWADVAAKATAKAELAAEQSAASQNRAERSAESATRVQTRLSVLVADSAKAILDEPGVIEELKKALSAPLTRLSIDEDNRLVLKGPVAVDEGFIFLNDEGRKVVELSTTPSGGVVTVMDKASNPKLMLDNETDVRGGRATFYAGKPGEGTGRLFHVTGHQFNEPWP